MHVVYQWPVTVAGDGDPVASPRVVEYAYTSPLGILAIQLLLIFGGALLLRPSHPGWSALLALSGLALVLLAGTTEMRYTITCTATGFTVTAKKRIGWKRRATYAWSDVRETRYREIKRASYFAVITDRGRAFEVRRGVKGRFHVLIATFNTMTSHLPYVWQPEGPGSSRLWRYGFNRYRRVPRTTYQHGVIA